MRQSKYKLIRVPDDYPFPFKVRADGVKFAFHHRVVAERTLGRYLTEHEVVHHIDASLPQPLFDAPDNLRVYPSQVEHMRDAHRRCDRESLSLCF